MELKNGMKIKVLKKKIKEFRCEYDCLCKPRKIVINLPVEINIAWDFGNTAFQCKNKKVYKKNRKLRAKIL